MAQSTFTPIFRAMLAWANSLVDDIYGLVTEILPVALPVLGIVIAVTFGLKFIKMVMK